MNKIEFAKINKKEDMIMAFNQLKDDYSILFQQIQELTNNWNELEEWLLNHYEVKNKTQNECIDEVLDKMKEIKGGSKE